MGLGTYLIYSKHCIQYFLQLGYLEVVVVNSRMLLTYVIRLTLINVVLDNRLYGYFIYVQAITLLSRLSSYFGPNNLGFILISN